MTGSQESVNRAGTAALPHEWRRWEGFVGGFGDRFLEAPVPVVRLRQVHGSRVFCVDGLVPGLHAGIEADALVVHRGAVAAVATADCVPILLVDPLSGWAAAVHAGWRGTVAGVVSAAVAAARADGIAARDLHAALGPSIGPCCYEVGPEVADAFGQRGFSVIRARAGERFYVDLRGCNRSLLSSAGLLPARIRACGPCTRCRSDLYHSYRSDRDGAGRQWSWVGWADPARQKDSRDTA